MTDFDVIKLDATGVEKLRYTGELIERGETWVCVRARFNFDRAELGFATFLRGDVFTEWFYSNRWYNVFRVEDGQDGQLKGWYCNITRPAVITENTVSAEDLVLDILVSPSGEIHILDEDEFAELDLPPQETGAALNAVELIRAAVVSGTPPFDDLHPSR